MKYDTVRMNYAVFSDGMLTGTIGDQPYHVRLAWTSILFEAEKLRGKVKLPIRQLAHNAKITIEEAADALRRLQAPDPLSSSPDYEGRRLLPLEGQPNWYLVTTWEQHAKERERYFHRLRQQRHDSKKKTEVQLRPWKDE